MVATQEAPQKCFNNKKGKIDICLINITFDESKDKEDQNISKSKKVEIFKRQDLNKVNQFIKAWISGKGLTLMNCIHLLKQSLKEK